MALIEPIFGKPFEQVEDGISLIAVDPALDCARDEALALRLHFFPDLLPHCTAKIGFPERRRGNLRACITCSW